MLAKLVDAPFDDDAWLFELKWDGYRAIATINEGEVKLYSRKGNVFDRYEEVEEEMRKLPFNAVMDGEVIILKEEGRADFQLLQNIDSNPDMPLAFYAFDLLHFNGYDLSKVPLIERKRLLEEVLPESDILLYSEHFENTGLKIYDFAAKHELEGIIGKRKNSLYSSGKRSSEWVKIKTQKHQEAVIVGFTEPRGSREYFGSLVLAAHQAGKLTYIGNSGGGFTEKMLKELYDKMKKLTVKTAPAAEKLPKTKDITWIKPKLVVELSFSEWTADKTMRHPIFRGMREDKSPKEVVLEVETGSVVPDVKSSPAKGDTSPKKPVIKSQNHLWRKPSNTKKPETLKHDAKEQIITLDGHKIKLTNLDKVLWPEDNYTKRDLIEYYLNISAYILPYIIDRPQSQNRFPNGIHGKSFYKKDMKGDAPEWAETLALPSDSHSGMINYLICNDKATLIYMAQLACIEINPWNSRKQHMDMPDWIVMDIDPSEKNTFDEVVEAALAVKEVLDLAGIEGYPKTSGSSGIHIYIPMGAKYTYDQGKMFANIIAEMVHEMLPATTTIERMTKNRGDKIYIDYLQNRRGQTLAAAYSVRPKEGATVSTPLRWEEVRPGLLPTDFTIRNIFNRLDRLGDIFRPVIGPGIDMKKALGRLSGE
ncbi:MAG: DNA ligase D, partial [Bacteroidota bacterium]|nr:DNA ligase D [Bacteroidota bacterium]